MRLHIAHKIVHIICKIAMSAIKVLSIIIIKFI